jgi:hypothetical protein
MLSTVKPNQNDGAILGVNSRVELNFDDDEYFGQ